MEDVESVIIEDDFSATVTCYKEAALLLIKYYFPNIVWRDTTTIKENTSRLVSVK